LPPPRTFSFRDIALTTQKEKSRMTIKHVVCGLLLLMLPAVGAQAAPAGQWPTLAKQLRQDKIVPGSALERLIQDNQDFRVLRPAEASDTIGVPAWLRVMWRKAHPEVNYSAKDPTGGYPHALKEIHEWMLTHQDLLPGLPEADVPPALDKAATVGTNLRISGSATVSRSESDIRINFFNPTQIIGASNNIGGSGQQAHFYSSDSGATWGQTSLPLQTGDSFHSDPAVDWRSDSTAWAATMGINAAATVLKVQGYKSTTGGATWTFDGTISGSQTNTDKELIWVDHSATSTFKDNIYACWHNGNPAYVNRRTTAWQTPIQVSGSETTGTAIGCDVKTNSAGEVFVFYPDTGSSKIYYVKSTNGGVSWSTPAAVATTLDSYDIGVPSFNNRRALIYAAGGAYKTGTKNMVYVAYTDLTGATGCTGPANEPGASTSSTCKSRIWVARSTNGGSSWTKAMINNQASLNDQYNQWLAVDETTGLVSVMYYDTVNDAGRKKVDVYYQSSADDGVTWSTPLKVTTATTDETIAGADSGNQFGDYNGLSGWNNKFFPSWTDRRSGGKEEIWTAAVTESGGTCTPPAAPSGLTASAISGTQINLSWTAVSGATSYNVYRATASGGPYSLVGSSATNSFSDTGLTCNTAYFYRVRAVLGCESADSNQASATTPTCSCTNTTLYNSGGFEALTGLGGWSTGTFVSGGSTADWRGVQTCTANGGTKIFRFGGTGCTTDYTSSRFTYAQPNGTAGISVPAGATTTRLTFAHRRRFESGFDGGTLAVSLNGTNYTYVPASALTGATYNGTTSASCPPAGGGGVAVFTGAATSFSTTTVNLDTVCNLITGGSGGCAGQAVRIGFTSITDCSITDDGWFLDDVTVSACVP
jgi:hypothetical protein